jgi:hypothetical protein
MRSHKARADRSSARSAWRSSCSSAPPC